MFMEGLVLSNRYRLLSKLGEGGMGSVWRADDLVLRTPVAVKLIDPAIATSVEATERFKREAQAAAALRSSHVVQILEYGVEGDTPFIAMEMLEGESLAGRLSKVSSLPPWEVAKILGQVGKALSLAHQRGVVHRDLKPDNVFLAREGDEEIAKVLDFGIAKATGSMSTSGGMQTRTGAMLGTPYYMSPEQMQGKRTVDHRTDIWSLGIIAVECLTGHRPFDAPTLGGLAVAICTESVPPPSSMGSVPPGFDAWFARTVHRDPDMRYSSVSEAVSALVAVCQGQLLPSVAQVPTASAAQAPLAPATAPGSIGSFSQGLPTNASLGLTPGPTSKTIPGVTSARRIWGMVAIAVVLVFTGIAGFFALRQTAAIEPSSEPEAEVGVAAAPEAPKPAAPPRVDPHPSPPPVPATLSSAAASVDAGLPEPPKPRTRPTVRRSTPRRARPVPPRPEPGKPKPVPAPPEPSAPVKPKVSSPPAQQSAEERLGF